MRANTDIAWSLAVTAPTSAPSRVRPRQERFVRRRGLLQLETIHDPWPGRLMQRVGESLAIAGHEPVEEQVPIARPSRRRTARSIEPRNLMMSTSAGPRVESSKSSSPRRSS